MKSKQQQKAEEDAMQMLHDAKQGSPDALQAMRSAQARIWTTIEIDAVNTFMRYCNVLQTLPRQNAHGSIYLKRHFLDAKHELAEIQWMIFLERSFYLTCVAFNDGAIAYWLLTDFDKPLCDVSIWVQRTSFGEVQCKSYFAKQGKRH